MNICYLIIIHILFVRLTPLWLYFFFIFDCPHISSHIITSSGITIYSFTPLIFYNIFMGIPRSSMPIRSYRLSTFCYDNRQFNKTVDLSLSALPMSSLSISLLMCSQLTPLWYNSPSAIPIS